MSSPCAKLIKDLEEQRKKEVAELRRAAAHTPLAQGNPGGSAAAQELSRILATAEVQVASLRARVDENTQPLLGRNGRSPERASIGGRSGAAQPRLRDSQEELEDLVQRREQAAMSGELDVASGIADFKVIEPPRPHPLVVPNRFGCCSLRDGCCAVCRRLHDLCGEPDLRPVFFDANDLRPKWSCRSSAW